MNIFYNKEGFGDTLLISIKPFDQENYSYEKNGDIVKIRDGNDETTGFNILNASKHVTFTAAKGKVEITEQLTEQLNNLIRQAGFPDQLETGSPKFVVGYVKEKEEHPRADKLSICKVDTGDEELQIVCGAPNVDAGQKVVVAKIGAVMPDGLVIRPSELRGVPSQGMICSAKELQLPDAPGERGILILDDSYTVGEEFKF